MNGFCFIIKKSAEIVGARCVVLTHLGVLLVIDFITTLINTWRKCYQINVWSQFLQQHFVPDLYERLHVS